MSDLYDAIQYVQSLSPEQQQELASHFGLDVADDYHDDEDDLLTGWEVERELQAWRLANRDAARELSPEDWDDIGDAVAEGSSVEDAYAEWATDTEEQQAREDLARIRSQAEAREGRELTRAELASLVDAYDQAEAQGLDDLDWQPLNLDDADDVEAYFNQRLAAPPAPVDDEPRELNADDPAALIDAVLAGETVTVAPDPEPTTNHDDGAAAPEGNDDHE